MKQQQSAIHWQIGLAFFAFILIGASDGATGVLIPGIREQYDINKAVVSWLFLCGSAGYLVAAFTSGWLIKFLGQRRFLLVGTATLIAGATSMSLMPPFPLLALSSFPIGFGVAVLDTGLNGYIAVLPRNTALLNYLHAFYGVGALLGPIVASIIFVIGLHWNAVYGVWIGMGLIFFLSAFRAFSEQNSGNISEEHKFENSATGGMRQILRLPTVWIAAIFLAFYVGTEVSLGSWSYSFLTEQRHEADLFSAWTISAYWMGLTAGRLVLARVIGKLTERVTIQICLAGVMLSVLLIWLIPIGIVSAICLCLTGFFLGPIFPTTIALLPQLFSKRLLTNAIALVVSLGSLGGALFPWLAGNLAQILGLWVILPYAITLTSMMLICWILLQIQQIKNTYQA